MTMEWEDRLFDRVETWLAPYAYLPPWTTSELRRGAFRGFVRFYLLLAGSMLVLVAAEVSHPVWTSLGAFGAEVAGVGLLAVCIGLFLSAIVVLATPLGRDLRYRRARKAEYLRRTPIRWVPGNGLGPVLQTALMVVPVAWIAVLAVQLPHPGVQAGWSILLTAGLATPAVAILSVFPCVRRLGVTRDGLLVQLGYLPTLLLPWEQIGGVGPDFLMIPGSAMIGPLRLTRRQGAAALGAGALPGTRQNLP